MVKYGRTYRELERLSWEKSGKIKKPPTVGGFVGGSWVGALSKSDRKDLRQHSYIPFSRINLNLSVTASSLQTLHILFGDLARGSGSCASNMLFIFFPQRQQVIGLTNFLCAEKLLKFISICTHVNS